MKKKMYYVLALTAAVALLGGCGKKESKTENAKNTTSGNQTEITLGKDIKISGGGVELSDKTLYITGGGEYTISGEADDIAVLVETDDDVRIVLNGATMTNPNGAVIYGKRANSLSVETAEGTENVLTDGTSYETDADGKTFGKATICCSDDLVLSGSGTLVINGNYKHGIAGDDEVYFQGGTYDIKAMEKDGVHANDLLCIEDGEFHIEAASDCMESEADLTINGGTITGSSSDEGIEAKGNLEVNGGTIALTVTDDGMNAGSSLSINGGDISIHAKQGDALDSNGSLEINGGKITAYGDSVPEGALDCDNAQILINGGTVIAVGDENSEISEQSKQNTIVLGQYDKGAKIAILTESGEEVISFTLEESKSSIILSSEKFESGKTYKVMVDGTEDQSLTLNATVVSVSGAIRKDMPQMGNMGDMKDMGKPGQKGDMGGERPDFPPQR